VSCPTTSALAAAVRRRRLGFAVIAARGTSDHAGVYAQYVLGGLARLPGMDECVVLGRGYNLATAFEWALKLKELALVHAQAYSTADFQHGPVASLGQGGQVLAVLAHGPLADDLRALLLELRRDRYARVVALAEDALEGIDHLRFPDRLPEWLSPIVDIVPAQLFAAALATAKGYDTERPRGLQMVTLTR